MYLDCYIIENLLINYIIINCTIYLTKIYTKKFRQILGAIIGTIYSVAYVFNGLEVLFTIPLKFLFMIFIVLISFNISSKKEFIRILFSFYLVNIFVSGTTYFIIYFTSITHQTISFLIVSAYISCILLKMIINQFKLLKHVEEMTKKITINLLNKDIECIALLDSGNLLQDPISKNDVVIVKSNILQEFLPDGCNFENMDICDIEDVIDNLHPNISSRVRLIPYKHVGNNSSQMILGIKADYLKIDDKKISNIIIGISDFKDIDYSAILNPRIL